MEAVFKHGVYEGLEARGGRSIGKRARSEYMRANLTHIIQNVLAKGLRQCNDELRVRNIEGFAHCIQVDAIRTSALEIPSRRRFARSDRTNEKDRMHNMLTSNEMEGKEHRMEQMPSQPHRYPRGHSEPTYYAPDL